MECEVSCSLEDHNKQIRPALCGPLYDGSMKAPRWLEPPNQKKEKETNYVDPIGSDYRVNMDKRLIDTM
jgi:hypothetical protein